MKTITISTFIKANQYSDSPTAGKGQIEIISRLSIFHIPYTLTWISCRANTGTMMISAQCQACNWGAQYCRLLFSVPNSAKGTQIPTCNIIAAAVNSLATYMLDNLLDIVKGYHMYSRIDRLLQTRRWRIMKRILDSYYGCDLPLEPIIPPCRARENQRDIKAEIDPNFT